MPPESAPFSLSPQAFSELKEIVIDEFGPDQNYEEVAEMGLRVLRLFSLLQLPEFSQMSVEMRQPSETELKALRYIHQCFCHGQSTPTVRGVSEAIGRRSSRSGARMIRQLINAGFLYRDESGALVIRKGIPGLNESLDV